jgi:hypothetical protein
MTLHPISGKSYLLLLALLLISAFAPAQTAVPVVLAPVPQLQFFDQSGRPLSFGCVFTFQSQTTTPLATFSDFTGQYQNQNPVLLNAGGSANIWLQSGQAYSLVVKSSGGANCALGQTIYTVDGVGGGASQLTTVVTPSGGSAAFTVQSQNQLFTLTLAANTAGQPVTFIGTVAPAIITFQITEDGGGAHTFSWPSNMIGAAPIDTTANHTTSQTFIWNGTTIMPIGPGFTSAANVLLPGPVSSINNVLYVGTALYPTIAKALAAVPSAGASIIVAPSGYRETFNSHYDLGNGTTNAVILMMNNDVILTCNVTDGSYCFKVHEASGIVGVRSEVVNVNRSGGSVISLASTLNVVNVIQTGEDPQGSLTLSDFTIDNVNNGAVSGAFVNLLDLNDSSIIQHIKAAYIPHMGLHISATVGGVKSIGPLNIDNCYFDGVSKTGARPLVIESDGSGATNQVNVIGGFYINAGSSLADIEINGGGNTQGALQQILISGAYTQQSAPSTAVTGIKIIDAAGVTIQTSSFQVTDATTGHTGISITQSGAGRTHSISVQNFRLDSGGGNIGLNNLITGKTVLNAVGTGNIPGYIYGGSAGTQTPSNYIFDDLPEDLTKISIATGVAADGGGYKHKRFGATCTTGSTAGNSCTTAYTWTTAFADSSYTVSCNGVNAVNGPVWDVESKTAAGFTFRVYTIVALASSYGEVDCIAVHD